MAPHANLAVPFWRAHVADASVSAERACPATSTRQAPPWQCPPAFQTGRAISTVSMPVSSLGEVDSLIVFICGVFQMFCVFDATCGKDVVTGFAVFMAFEIRVVPRDPALGFIHE
jgi:hypothetical protein